MTRTARAMISLIGKLQDEGRPLKLAEVGVQTGRTSRLCLQRFPELSAILIDPWIESEACKDAQGLYERTVRRSAFAKDRREVWRMKSLEAAPRVKDRSLSIVLVDGDHSYEAALTDMEAWWPKLMRGGILAADDYTRRFTKTVKRAVDQWSRKHEIRGEAISYGKVWWCRRE